MGTRRGARVTFRSSLGQKLLRAPQPGGRLSLCNALFLDISQIGGSYVNLPWIRNLFLNIKNARGEGILTARP